MLTGPRFTLAVCTAVSLLATAPLSVSGAQAIPPTGLDFTAVDQFWKIVDILAKDAEPTEAQWQTLLSTPGYRLAATNLGPVTRPALEVAFRPSRRADFAKLSTGTSDDALMLRHLARAAQERSALVALRDSLVHSTPIADAVARAAKLLPPGATRNGPPPLVAFAVFKDDGFSLPQGVVIDLLYARSTPLIAILAHEFHHTFVNRINKPAPVGPPAPDATIRDAIYSARNEGIADQIDKPYPVTNPNPAMAEYVTRYNAEYERTPALLRQFDSLLTVIADAPGKMADLGMTAQMLFWSNGHPNGAYMAREIIETFGVDSLFPGERDPAAFFRTYASAERVHRRPPPFSAKTWRVINDLDAKYWRR